MKKLTASWKRGFAAAKAAKEYSNGDRPGEKMGAALFSGSILISIGFNTYDKTHPSSKKKNFSVHAEHACIIKRQYKEDGNNLTMYVYRETQVNKGVLLPSISRPCENCLGILKLAGVKRVRFYGKVDPEEIKL
jgi:tRNA(Arg) A34 adenosine deaminase TadA